MSNMGMEGCAFGLASPPPSGRGAIAIVQLRGDIDAGLRGAGIAGVGVGEVKVRSLAGIDEGLVARWSATSASVMPHGGPAVVAALLQLFADAGLRPMQEGGHGADWPEARDEHEASMLATLARAASPLAVDLLLDQPRRWTEGDAGEFDEADERRWHRLNRLIEPPLVVALGPPNIGKSTLLNTLAGRSVALVADQPGTTRDHVGVLLDLGGLVVRYLDTPGIGHASSARGVEGQAEAEAIRLAGSADLILICHDPTSAARSPPTGVDFLAVLLRSDLGGSLRAAEVAVSAHHGRGLAELVTAIRERLVPAGDISNPRPWRYWA